MNCGDSSKTFATMLKSPQGIYVPFYNVSLKLQKKDVHDYLNNLFFLQMGIFQVAKYGDPPIYLRVRLSFAGILGRVEEAK